MVTVDSPRVTRTAPGRSASLPSLLENIVTVSLYSCIATCSARLSQSHEHRRTVGQPKLNAQNQTRLLRWQAQAASR